MIVEIINGLPEEAEVDDVIERIILLSKITRAQKQIERGEVYSMQEMQELVKLWKQTKRQNQKKVKYC